MARFWSVLRLVLVIVLVIASGLGLANVYFEGDAAQAKAALVACGGKECGTSPRRIERSPFGHHYELVAQREPKPKAAAMVSLDCRRAFIFLGEWSCQEGPPR